MIEEWLKLLERNTKWKTGKASEKVLINREKRLRMLMESRKACPKRISESLFVYYYNQRLFRNQELATSYSYQFANEFFPEHLILLEKIIEEVESHISNKESINLISDQEVIELLDVSAAEKESMG